MPRVALTVQDIAITGTTVAAVAGDAANGHEFVNDGRCFLRVINGGGGSINVTALTPNSTAGGNAIADRVVAVGAGVTKEIGPFAPNEYNNSSGKVDVDLSGATSVTLAAVRLG